MIVWTALHLCTFLVTAPNTQESAATASTVSDVNDVAKHRPTTTSREVCPNVNTDELAVLTTLRQRHQELDKRDAQLQARDKEFAEKREAFETRMNTLKEEISKLEARLNMGEPARLAHEQHLNTLVDTLNSLSARKAAPILANVDPDLVSTLLMRLGPSRSAALLPLMPSAKAAKLVEQLGDVGIAKGEKSP